MNRWLIVLLAMVPLLFGGLILGVGVWLWMDLQRAAERAREAQLRMFSGNNLKQIVLALQNYHDMYNAYPPAVVTDQEGQPIYSGRVLLLPFMEQNAVFQQFDRNQAWDSPENLRVSQTRIKSFESPHKPELDGRCDYVFVSGAGTAFPPGKNTSFADIKDGVAQTLVVVETKNGPASWAAPGDWDAASGPIPVGYLAQYTMVGFADGKVFSLQTDPPLSQSGALCSIAGGEAISLDELPSFHSKTARSKP